MAYEIKYFYLMKQSERIDSTTIVLSSGIASVLSTIISNPFEVLKIRL